MRLLILCLIAGLVCSGEATSTPTELPPAAQKACHDAETTIGKAHDAFLLLVKKEQDRLVATLQREQERETKKGNLNSALAIKARIEAVQNGLLLSQVEATGDLLGGTAPPAKPGLAALACDGSLPTAPGQEVPSAPETVAKFLSTAICATIPKGDQTRYNLTLLDGGMVVASTGPAESVNGALWNDLQAAGFKRIDSTGLAAWFVLDGKAGAKFTAYDPTTASAPLRLWAKSFSKAP